ncbi:MAG: serine hydrolase domain-containing protein [Sphingopyxis sp.]|nr:serine hydrolase domain-containing protein [Sphingopyxis sp.]
MTSQNAPASIESAPIGDAGVARDALERLDASFGERVKAGRMAGIVYAVARHGCLVHQSAIGHADVDTGRAMGPDTVFRLASMTKPVTAIALMMLHEEGRFALDDPLSNYLPAFADIKVLRALDAAPDDVVDLDRPITIRHILQHSAGLGLGLGIGLTGEALLAEIDVYNPGHSLADDVDNVAKVPLVYQPGTIWNYSLAPDIQARLVEILSGESFADFIQKRIFDPLGMVDTSFAVRDDMAGRVASVYWREGDTLTRWREGHMPPLPPIISKWPQPFFNLDNLEVVSERGSFGLYSTVGDYLRFAQMLLNGGELDGVRIIGADTLDLMIADSVGDLPLMWPVQGLGFGLGFAVLRDPAAAGYAGTPGMFHWDGALGTVMWVDRARDLVVVGMAQHLLIEELTPDALGAELRNHIYPALRG